MILAALGTMACFLLSLAIAILIACMIDVGKR